MKQYFRLFGLLLVFSLVLTACGTQATNEPEGTEGAPAGENITLTLWHSYHAGGGEEGALNQLIADYQVSNPNVQVDVLAVPFDQIFNKYNTETAAGGGPDLITFPNDNLFQQVQDGLILDVTDKLSGNLDNISDAGLAGMTVDGKLYGVPGIIKAIGVYYNEETVETPPTTTDELLTAVENGLRVGLISQMYFQFGWAGVFGGQIWDETGNCVADQGGVVDAWQYLLDLKAAGATFDADGAKIASLFKEGQLDLVFDGPWMFGEYNTTFGESLGVAQWPTGPNGDHGTPLAGVDSWHVGPNSQNVDAALDLAMYIFGKEGQQVYSDTALDPMVRTDIQPNDERIATFAEIAANGTPRPLATYLNGFWGPFGDNYTAMIEGQITPEEAVAAACTGMNEANQ